MNNKATPENLERIAKQLKAAYGHLTGDCFPGPPTTIVADLMDIAAELRAALSRKAETPESVTLDAKRYQYMRNNAAFRDRNGPGLYWYLPRFQKGSPAERLDASIDDQITAPKAQS